MIVMQSQGYPVSRDMMLLKGNKLYQAMVGKMTLSRIQHTLKLGWLNHFRKMHPLMNLQSAQGIKHVRAEASVKGLMAFLGIFEVPSGAEYREFRSGFQYG